MKTKTDLKSGITPLSACRNVKVDRHDRGGQQGKKVFATCPFHGLWVPSSGWFPLSANVRWDENAARLTASSGSGGYGPFM